jgi:hypothetical protein
MSSINGYNSKNITSIAETTNDDSYLRNKNQNDIQSLFKVCDLDGSGTIDRNELRQLCPNLSSFDIDSVFKDMDKNSDGLISYNEFCEGFGGLIATSENTNNISPLTTPTLDDKNHKILFHNLTLSFKSLSWLVLI